MLDTRIIFVHSKRSGVNYMQIPIAGLVKIDFPYF